MDRQLLVIATKNIGKIKEIKELIDPLKIDIKTLEDFGPIVDIEEDGVTFEENAYKKASITARMLGIPAMADDSGLMVDALKGEPGVLSARYAGENCTNQQRCAKLLENMKGAKDRKAAFECVISIAVPTGKALTYIGRCEGLITEKPSGTSGFGYDPLFFYPPLNKTFAQMSIAEKNEVSHRGKALKQVKEELDNIIKWIKLHTPEIQTIKGYQGCGL